MEGIPIGVADDLSGIILNKVGEQIRYHNLRFLVLEMDGRKTTRIKVTKL